MRSRIRSVLTLVILLASCMRAAIAQQHPIDQEASALLDGQVDAVCYSGYRASERPDRGDGAANPSRPLSRGTPNRERCRAAGNPVRQPPL